MPHPSDSNYILYKASLSSPADEAEDIKYACKYAPVLGYTHPLKLKLYHTEDLNFVLPCQWLLIEGTCTVINQGSAVWCLWCFDWSTHCRGASDLGTGDTAARGGLPAVSWHALPSFRWDSVSHQRSTMRRRVGVLAVGKQRTWGKLSGVCFTPSKHQELYMGRVTWLKTSLPSPTSRIWIILPLRICAVWAY